MEDTQESESTIDAQSRLRPPESLGRRSERVWPD